MTPAEEYLARIAHSAHRDKDSSVPAWEDSHVHRQDCAAHAHMFLAGAELDPIAGYAGEVDKKTGEFVTSGPVMRDKATMALYRLRRKAMAAAVPFEQTPEQLALRVDEARRLAAFVAERKLELEQQAQRQAQAQRDREQAAEHAAAAARELAAAAQRRAAAQAIREKAQRVADELREKFERAQSEAETPAPAPSSLDDAPVFGPR